MAVYRLPLRADLAPLFLDLVAQVQETLAVADQDFSPEGAHETHFSTPTFRDTPTDMLERELLPQMSHDPLDALELRSLTENSLRVLKSGRLEILEKGLLGALGKEEILIPADQVWDWLSGLNDLRIYLAALLARAGGASELQELDWEALEELVDQVFGGDATPDACQTRVDEALIALAYLLVSWWQESLLTQVNSQEESG